MNTLSILGVFVGIALLVLAIPHIDIARSGIQAVVSSPIASLVGILTLIMAVGGTLIALVYGLAGRF